MHRVVVNLEMSSVEHCATVSEALMAVPGVSLEIPAWTQGRHLTVTIDTDDPDVVDIVREIAWEFDGLAIQHSLHLAEVS